jgi:hypothetical protein
MSFSPGLASTRLGPASKTPQPEHVTITKTFWRGTAILATLSLVCLAALVVTDVGHDLYPSRLHGQAAALALMLAGASYVLLHLKRSAGRGERWRALFLGAAFVLWGGEQFVPPGRLQTFMDLVVVVIFVVDLCLMIAAKFAQVPGGG